MNFKAYKDDRTIAIVSEKGCLELTRIKLPNGDITNTIATHKESPNFEHWHELTDTESKQLIKGFLNKTHSLIISIKEKLDL